LSYSLTQLNKAIDIRKQAVDQSEKRQHTFTMQLTALIAEAEALRNEHPGCGVEKMYYVLRPSFIGRDRFIELMMDVGFRLSRARNFRRTTYSGQLFYPNLIQGMTVSDPSTVWQSDITFISVADRFYYAVFIIDVYSKKIVGYKLSSHMRAIANVEALTMALRLHKAPQIHHSDRGSQYIYTQYVELLKLHDTKISMGLKAQDNAYAERINRTIKEEYLQVWSPKNYDQLKMQVTKAVTHYNTKRPHNHLNRLTPAEFENRCLTDPHFKKPTITIFDENNI
jgi:transposase InsO family protein